MVPRPARLAGLVAALGLTAAGCSFPGTPSAGAAPASAAVTVSPSPADSRTPLQKLRAGIPTVKSPRYHYSIKSSIDAKSGVLDPPDKIAETLNYQHYTNPSHTETTITLQTEDRAWVMVKFTPAYLASQSSLPNKWMSLDTKKLTYADGTPYVYSGDLEAGEINEIFDEVTDIHEVGADHFAGVTDLSNADDGHEIFSAAQFKALGSKVAHVPFTAALDGHGRMTTATLRLPATGKYKASTWEITFDEYGTAAVPKLPTAAEQTKAPASVYGWYS